MPTKEPGTDALTTDGSISEQRERAQGDGDYFVEVIVYDGVGKRFGGVGAVKAALLERVLREMAKSAADFAESDDTLAVESRERCGFTQARAKFAAGTRVRVVGHPDHSLPPALDGCTGWRGSVGEAKGGNLFDVNLDDADPVPTVQLHAEQLERVT